MEKIAIGFLLTFSTWIGVSPAPSQSRVWTIEKSWIKEGKYYQFQASSNLISQECKLNPNSELQAPMIIHGIHKFLGDGELILQTGTTDFTQAVPFYHAPSIKCDVIAKYDNITWIAHGYSSYFSRFKKFPQIKASTSMATFQSISMNIISAGALVMLAIFSAVVFFNKVSRTLAFNIIGSCLFFSTYFIFVTLNYFPFQMSMLTAHKIADFGLWFGAFFFVNGLMEKGVIGKYAFRIFLASTSFALLLIAFGTNGDVVQLGTTVPFPVVMFLLTRALLGEWKKYKKEKRAASIFHFVSVLTFTAAAFYDILIVTGLLDGYPVFSIGVLFAIFTLTLAVNDEITQTYRERDGLLVSLEEKVEEKTLGLQTALVEKEQAQAELIQSAKLASLGTLSAGIAHEINNSINYVNGAIHPLEILIKDVKMEEKQKIVVMKLLKSIKDGSKMTVDIVRSLRNYTGLNQAKYSDVSLDETAQNVLTILRNKYSGKVEIINNMNPNVTLFSNKVGLNQILMNLVSNAIDAVGDNGKVMLSCIDENGQIKLSISDNGPGIPEELKHRIFDPFFTTKEVGQGTGLGLHIVKKEIENHQGTIEVKSEPGKGTEFLITFPKQTNMNTHKGAA